MAIRDLIRKCFNQVKSVLEFDLTFDGVVYKATKTSKQNEVKLRVAGLLPENVFRVYLDLAELHATPEVDGTVIIDGTTYRIVEIGNDPSDVYIRLDLGHKYATRR